ncbi:uncharacterized protein LOC115627764 isoform X3 [Scaptodrosophila lebanonensis]|uniref:Uncharacterized protein LOC115627764 isoform X3 n=1 Tax=Drosophila lebanonensis TaxID=7225 RepID=A0A6J2TTN3_DROLE|nr:uncharacterized protein LOC115627764 isoform X3 [Scaptodrosophila lebanonensis]
MNLFVVYIACIAIIFLVLPIIYMALQFSLWFILTKCCGRPPQRSNRRAQDIQLRPYTRQHFGNHRQGNVYTGSDDRANNRYGDIYFIEPNSEEAARIREQLEKDDKELPSYDEVMRMCNLTSPTPAPAAVVAPALPSSTDGVAISVAALPAPPYVEVDPNAQPPSITPSSVPPQCTVVSLEPSTSRAAQTTTSSSVIMTLSQTASNTEV